MTRRSQNGFAVITRRSSNRLCVVKTKSGGTFVVRTFARKAFQALVDALDKIEPASQPGWDGGWDYRPIRGSRVWSCHASGTAIDWNASQHPQGHGTAGWTETQVKQIRAFLASPAGRCFRWGADFSTTKDSMHFELTSKARWRAMFKRFWARR